MGAYCCPPHPGRASSQCWQLSGRRCMEQGKQGDTWHRPLIWWNSGSVQRIVVGDWKYARCKKKVQALQLQINSIHMAWHGMVNIFFSESLLIRNRSINWQIIDFLISCQIEPKIGTQRFPMMLITNMAEFYRNYRSIDQKSIDKLSIFSFLSNYSKN